MLPALADALERFSAELTTLAHLATQDDARPRTTAETRLRGYAINAVRRSTRNATQALRALVTDLQRLAESP